MLRHVRAERRVCRSCILEDLIRICHSHEIMISPNPNLHLDIGLIGSYHGLMTALILLKVKRLDLQQNWCHR